MKKLMSAEKKMKEEESKCTNFNFLRETKKKKFSLSAKNMNLKKISLRRLRIIII